MCLKLKFGCTENFNHLESKFGRSDSKTLNLLTRESKGISHTTSSPPEFHFGDYWGNGEPKPHQSDSKTKNQVSKTAQGSLSCLPGRRKFLKKISPNLLQISKKEKSGKQD